MNDYDYDYKGPVRLEIDDEREERFQEDWPNNDEWSVGTVNAYDNIRHEMGVIRKEADEVKQEEKQPKTTTSLSDDFFSNWEKPCVAAPPKEDFENVEIKNCLQKRLKIPARIWIRHSKWVFYKRLDPPSTPSAPSSRKTKSRV